ncbi:MAG: M48 family metalloprotease, partial [Rhizobiales bacterium]|nr:M48 family metalloprotease [Hyphomicrobiales bacterium]
QIYRVLGVGFMIGVIGGDSSQLIDEVVTQAALIQNFSYTRGFEEEADKNSVVLMEKLNRDPFAFINLLDRIIPPQKDKGSDTSWYSTHPGNKDRRKNIQLILKELGK